MPITVQWDDVEHTIVKVHFSGGFDFPAILTAWEQEIALEQSVGYPVYSINLFERVPFSVKGINIRELHHFAETMPPENLQMVIQVAENDMFRSILRSVMPKRNHAFHIVATLDEAYALINAHKAQNA